MLNFFRYIRSKLLSENRFSKYLIYALGEIFLLVLGILIALKVNNINQANNDQEKIKEYARSLIKDLQEDVLMAEVIRLQTISASNRIDSLAKMVENIELQDISNIDFVCLSWNLLYRPYSWNRVTLDQLKSSGSIQFIKNDSILKKLGEYDAFTHHLDEDYLNDKAKTESTIAIINQVTNNNYASIPNFRKHVLTKVNDPSYEEFSYFKEPEYAMGKSLNLKLITEDRHKLDEAINSLTRLQFHFNIRSDHELPRLQNWAQNLIQLLNEQYFNLD